MGHDPEPRFLFGPQLAKAEGLSRMPTSISADNFKTALGTCYDYINTGDLVNAKKWYAMAETQNAGLLLESSSDGMTQRRREALKGLKDALDVAEAAAAPTSTARCRFTRLSALEP